MEPRISKKDLEHLAELARVDLAPEREEKLLVDLERILEYFEELKLVSTDAVEPVAGGTTLENAYREDADARSFDRDAVVGAFPESEGGFLKIPPVFERNE